MLNNGIPKVSFHHIVVSWLFKEPTFYFQRSELPLSIDCIISFHSMQNVYFSVSRFYSNNFFFGEYSCNKEEKNEYSYKFWKEWLELQILQWNCIRIKHYSELQISFKNILKTIAFTI